MNKQTTEPNQESDLAKKVGAKSARRLKYSQSARKTWFGLGMMGLVGWSVITPTLAGILLGIWIDRTFTSNYSFTLMLLVTGLLAGCLNVWYWLGKESKELTDEENRMDSDSPEQDKSEKDVSQLPEKPDGQRRRGD